MAVNEIVTGDDSIAMSGTATGNNTKGVYGKSAGGGGVDGEAVGSGVSIAKAGSGRGLRLRRWLDGRDAR